MNTTLTIIATEHEVTVHENRVLLATFTDVHSALKYIERVLDVDETVADARRAVRDTENTLSVQLRADFVDDRHVFQTDDKGITSLQSVVQHTEPLDAPVPAKSSGDILQSK